MFKNILIGLGVFLICLVCGFAIAYSQIDSLKKGTDEKIDEWFNKPEVEQETDENTTTTAQITFGNDYIEVIVG